MEYSVGGAEADGGEKVTLTERDWEFILESLRNTKRAFSDTNYPTREMRRERLEVAQGVIDKVKAARVAGAGQSK